MAGFVFTGGAYSLHHRHLAPHYEFPIEYERKKAA